MAHNYKWRWPSEARHKFTGMVIIITMTLVNKKWYLCKRINMCVCGGRGGGGQKRGGRVQISYLPDMQLCTLYSYLPPLFLCFFFSIAKYWALYFFRTPPPTSLSYLFSQDPTHCTPQSKLLENFFKQNKAANQKLLLKSREERIFNFRKQETNVKYLQDIPWLII